MVRQGSTTVLGRRRSFLSTLGRLTAALAITATSLATAAPVGAQASDGLDGDTYASDTYGWSVTFDDRVWEAEEAENDPDANLEYRGVTLSTDGAFANVIVYDDGIDEAADCLADLDRIYTASDGWDGLAPARALDAPETSSDAEAELYVGTLILEDSELEAALYIECRDVDKATLSIVVTVVEARYEELLPDLEGLLAGIDTAGGSGTDDGPNGDGPVTRRTPTPGADDDPTPVEDDPTPDPSEDDPTPDDPPASSHNPDDQLGQDDAGTLDDGAYTSELGFSLTWDEDVFTGEADGDSVPGSGILLENPDTGATIEIAAFEDPEIEDCVRAEVDRFLDAADYVSAAITNGVRPPTSDNDAVGRVLRATEDTTRQDRKVIYVECRPLADEGPDGDPTFLVVRAISDDEEFRANRKLFEAILGAIIVGDEPATRSTEEPADEPTPRPRRTATPEPDAPPDLGETDIAGGVFVGASIPFRVTWDTGYWDVEEIASESLEGISIVTDEGAFGRVISAVTPADYTVDDCIASLLDGWTGTTADLERFEPAATEELDYPRGSEVVYAAGTFTFDDGNTAILISSGGCLEVDGGLIIMSVQIFNAVYADNAVAFNTVLDSLEVGEVARQQGLAVADPPAIVAAMAADLAPPDDIKRPTN